MSAPKGMVFVDPGAVVGQLPIEAGQQVADFGCGSGFFSYEFAKRVGNEGQVHALDVLPSALEAVASRAKTMGLTNVFPKRCNLERPQGSGLAPASMDWVIVKDILFQNQKKDIIIGEMARVMKPGGHGLIMEWHPDHAMVGPEKELRLHPDTLKKILEQVGLVVEKELNVGGFHYAFQIGHRP